MSTEDTAACQILSGAGRLRRPCAPAVFAGRVPLMLLDTFDQVPPQRRRSASIVDLTHPIPRLVREGSVTAEELRVQLRHLQLGELVAGPDVIRV